MWDFNVFRPRVSTKPKCVKNYISRFISMYYVQVHGSLIDLNVFWQRLLNYKIKAHYSIIFQSSFKLMLYNCMVHLFILNVEFHRIPRKWTYNNKMALLIWLILFYCLLHSTTKSHYYHVFDGDTIFSVVGNLAYKICTMEFLTEFFCVIIYLESNIQINTSE